MTQDLLKQLQVLAAAARKNALRAESSVRKKSGDEAGEAKGLTLKTARDIFSVEEKVTFGVGGSDPGQLSSPCDLAVDADGNFYVADEFNHRVQKFSPDWEFLLQFGGRGREKGKMWYPRGIVVNSQGEVVVADSWNHRLQVFSPDGRPIRTLGSYGEVQLSIPTRSQGVDNFNEPWGLASGPDDLLFIVDSTNHRICRYSPEGAPEGSWGGYGNGPGQFKFPKRICLTRDNGLLVSDWGNNRLQKFSLAGDLVWSFGEKGQGFGEFQGPCGVAVDPDGFIFVADELNHRIQKFTPGGSPVLAFGDGDDGGKGLYLPNGLLSAGERSVLVADCLNHRIVEYGYEPVSARETLKYLHHLFPEDTAYTVEYAAQLAESGNLSELESMGLHDPDFLSRLDPVRVVRCLEILSRGGVIEEATLPIERIIGDLEKNLDDSGRSLDELTRAKNSNNVEYRRLREAVRADPDNEKLAFDFKTFAVESRRVQQDLVRATREMEIAQEIFSSGLFLIGSYLLGRGRADSAFEIWEKVLRFDPAYAPLIKRLEELSGA